MKITLEDLFKFAETKEGEVDLAHPQYWVSAQYCTQVLSGDDVQSTHSFVEFEIAGNYVVIQLPDAFAEWSKNNSSPFGAPSKFTWEMVRKELKELIDAED